MGQPNVFDEMGTYWQQIADKGPTERQIQFIKVAVAKEGWILDLACGTGRHTIPLTKENFHVVGLDVSSKLLKIAKQRQPQVQLVKADVQYLPFIEKTFSAAISLDNSFGYLPTEEMDLESLKELHKTLQAKGLFVLDVFNREQLTQKYRKRLVNLQWLILPPLLKYPNRLSQSLLWAIYKWREYPSFFLLQKRTVNTEAERLCDLWLIIDKAGGKMQVFSHSARLYKLGRLNEMLVEAGFLVERVCGGYEGQDFTVKSTRLIILADAT
jgi:ubiquinone/menaquinone biosynthesis C-methylase UbiE